METASQDHILVVDDDEDLLSLNVALLEEAGFAVAGVATAQECLTAARRMRPDLVLLDINLPDMSGLELCRRLKADPETAEIAVVHLSGDLVSSEEQAAGLDSGADGYIARPISNNELIARVRAMLRLKHTETELRRVTKELQAQRLASMGTLSRGVAHDLNNALAPILMGINILKLKYAEVETQELLSTMEFSAQQGSAVAQQLLSCASEPAGDRLTIQPRRIIERAFQTLVTTFPKSIDLELALELDLWSVSANPDQIHHVLLNICENAKEAMPEGGNLVISAENTVLDSRFAERNPGARPGPHVTIRIRDTGAGMPTEVQGRIFDPFFTTHEFGKGVGLGLSTSLGIVQSHGGFLRVVSEAGKGSTFEIHLPAAPGTQSPVDDEPSTPAPRGNGELVMIVDDDRAIRMVAERVLETFGYRVLLASSGAEAAALYTEQGRNIALIIMDMMMPVLDGPATIRMLTAINSDVHIIASSGVKSNEGLARSLSPSVKGFLPKPYKANKLLHIVAAALEPRNPA